MFAKSLPARASASALSARARASSTRSGVACSGTRTRICDTLYSERSGFAFCAARNRSISLSFTWIFSSTSRSRRRESMICSRRSSRQASKATRSRSSARRKSASVILLLSAMRCTARSSCSSSMRMPVSRALWSCALSRISRSRIWRSNTARSGSAVPWRRSCRSALATAMLSSEKVITSLFTTATMRSTSCAPCASARSGRRNTAKSNRCIALEYLLERQRPAAAGREGRRVIRIGHRVARDVPRQQPDHVVGADLAHAVELELQEESGGALGRRSLDARHHCANHPAARVVLDPRQPLEQPLVQEGVIVPCNAVPPRRDGPLRGEVDLPHGVAREAVARVEHLRDLRGVLERGVENLRVLLEPAVLRRGIEGPVPEKPAAHRAQQVGFVLGAQRRGGREADPLVFEVVALPDGRAKRLLPVLREKARGQREGDLIRIAETVAADEAVFAEELGEVEVGERGVEDRDLVLVAEGCIHVEETRLQGLRQLLAEKPRAALEDEAAVEAEPGNRRV